MDSVVARAHAVRLRARVELAKDEINTLQACLVDMRVRSILFAATVHVRAIARRVATEQDSLEWDSIDRPLEAIESQLRLVRRAICTLGIPAARCRVDSGDSLGVGDRMVDSIGAGLAGRLAGLAEQAALLATTARHPTVTAELTRVQRMLDEARARLSEPLTAETRANIEVALQLTQPCLRAIQRAIADGGADAPLAPQN